MQKTQHYELKKPDITDPLRVADLNENSDLLDAAIKAVADTAADAASGLSDANARISTLTTALGSGGSNCRIATGSYTGTGTYGSSNKNSLTLPFAPKVIFIFPSQAAMNLNTNYIGMFGIGLIHAGVLLNTYQYYSSSTLTQLTISGTKITWYDTNSAACQFNLAATYYYAAIG